jgi:hypothetical protein
MSLRNNYTIYFFSQCYKKKCFQLTLCTYICIRLAENCRYTLAITEIITFLHCPKYTPVIQAKTTDVTNVISYLL